MMLSQTREPKVEPAHQTLRSSRLSPQMRNVTPRLMNAKAILPKVQTPGPPPTPMSDQDTLHHQRTDTLHILGKHRPQWRLHPVRYISDRPPSNPGLLALSRGKLGGVFCVRHTTKRMQYAMEILHLPSLQGGEFLRTMKKLHILRKIKKHSRTSQFILQPSSDIDHPIWWSNLLYLHIVTEYCPGTLEDRRGDPQLIEDEPMLGHIICELLEGVAYLHSVGIIHANLEPGNVLINTHGHCVISGFGGSFAVQRLQRPLRMALAAGQKEQLIITPGFSAPELWTSRSGMYKFDETVDSWSLGLIICSLLVPEIDHHVCIPPDVSIGALQHYKSSRLTPDDISLQLWIVCSPNTVTEFVSMMCQLERKDRLLLEDAQEIAKCNGWDKRMGAPFPSEISSPSRVPPVPKAHRKLTTKQIADFRTPIEIALEYWDADIPRYDDAFVPNLDFKPFR